jgi:Icc-related predicted phosphoesterase
MICRFKEVIMVCGNHEYWGSDLISMPLEYNKKIKELNGGTNPKNFRILDCSEFIIGDVVFIGATLWTDFNKHNEYSMSNADKENNDYKNIYKNDKLELIDPEFIYNLHKTHLEYIDSRCEFWENKKRIVVITHHAPLEDSIHDNFKGHIGNAYYYTDMSNLLINRKIDIYCHGHVHQSFDYFKYGTRIICNPRGYHTKTIQEYKNFFPKFQVSL